MEKIEIGVIGGSGLYDTSMLKDVSKVQLKTMKESEEKVKTIIKEVVNNIPEKRKCICQCALKDAKV